MKPSPPLAVSFREVRHFQPDDCLHYEPIAVRGRLHQWKIPVHRHEGLHQLQLIERGAARVTIDDVRHELQAPAALMLTPGSIHGFEYEHTCSGHQVTVPSEVLRASLAGAPSLVSRLAATLVLGPAQIAHDMGEATDLFLRLAGEFQTARPGRIEALQAQVVLLTLWFLRHGTELNATEQRQALRDTLVQRYRSLLELHFRQHQPLSFYAAALDVTADHLSRACRSIVGLSALDLMHERVLLEARRRLAFTSSPIVEIATLLGFEDPAYFSRFFTRLGGQSPSSYRGAVASGLAVRPTLSGVDPAVR